MSAVKRVAAVLMTRAAIALCGLSATLLFHASNALAQTQSQTQPQTLADAVLESRVKALSSELRCLVCQNQTVADSDAPVARDMREQVRAQLVAGKSEQEIKLYMTDRFGDFVLYKPALKANTLALWIGPFAALLIGAFLLVRLLRRKESIAASPALSNADRERARALLNDNSH
jgi:cytochrome c-type biogenesis protein CcmH